MTISAAPAIPDVPPRATNSFRFSMPEMGRNHFFALFTVFASLSLGLAPIFWGVFLDTLGKKELCRGKSACRSPIFSRCAI
jgi:hypothetical protein